MSNPASLLRTGHVLNEYRVESVLGAGTFGATYLATDTKTKLSVALKEYLPMDIATRLPDQKVSARTKADSESFKSGLLRFLDEARALESFGHPNVVRVTRCFEGNGGAYMVMEFIEGQPLTKWSDARRPLSQQQVLNIVGPLLDGLAVIHKAGYVHRDIKPGNVLIRADDSPVLLDFGPVRAARGGDQELSMLVAPGYAPVEQYYADGKQGPWTDLYSVGAMLYWIITGSRPAAAIARLRKDSMTPASALRLGSAPCPYTEAFLDAIDWALKPNAEDRPQSTAALMAKLGIPEREDGTERTQRIVTISAGAKSNSTQQATPAEAAGTSAGTAAGRFPPELLRRVEAAARLHLGPIAPVFVRNASHKATSLTDLCNLVAREINDDKARALFLTKCVNDEHTSLP